MASSMSCQASVRRRELHSRLTWTLTWYMVLFTLTTAEQLPAGTRARSLTEDVSVLQVTFTGSTEVGRLIMKASAESNLKPVYLELGGKSPLIIFDDADVDMAVELAVSANFFNKVNDRTCMHDAFRSYIFQCL